MYIAFTLSLTQSQGDIAAQYEEVMKKVQTLNVISDSNRLLRDERDQLTKQVRLEYVYKNYTCTCIITRRMQDIAGRAFASCVGISTIGATDYQKTCVGW